MTYSVVVTNSGDSSNSRGSCCSNGPSTVVITDVVRSASQSRSRQWLYRKEDGSVFALWDPSWCCCQWPPVQCSNKPQALAYILPPTGFQQLSTV